LLCFVRSIEGEAAEGMPDLKIAAELHRPA
jgi:hypothetical protein